MRLTIAMAVVVNGLLLGCEWPIALDPQELPIPRGTDEVESHSTCAMPEGTRLHGTAAHPYCETEQDGGIWACYLCEQPSGCCDCLNGVHDGRRLDVVYCLTTCCEGTLDQGMAR